MRLSSRVKERLKARGVDVRDVQFTHQERRAAASERDVAPSFLELALELAANVTSSENPEYSALRPLARRVMKLGDARVAEAARREVVGRRTKPRPRAAARRSA